MTNRILHLVQDGEPMPEKFPERTNMFEPAEMYMLREHLILMIKMNLEAIENNRPQVDKGAADVKDTDLHIRQRQELLVWAEAQPGEMVYVALYPVSTEEPEEVL